MSLSRLSLLLAAVGQLPLLSLASVENPSISPRPPMGFNNWARFMCQLNQTLFTTTADAMASNGLLDAGYNHINLDDCWLEHSRAPNGSLVWNSTMFPNGLIWLGDYLHGKGFKFGIYEDAGTMTCGGYPGSKDHENLDAATFASWGVDYVKIDGCNLLNASDPRPAEEQFEVLYARWHSALSSQSRPMVFSESAPAYFSPDFQSPVHVNNTDWYKVMKFVRSHGELARHSNDIKVYGIEGVYEPGGHWESIMTNYGYNTLLARYQKCGFYNDPDFLIPFPDLTIEEKKSHFALWASFSAPLIISTYIPDLTDAELKYLTNRDIIAVDQDSLCSQATLVSQNKHWDVLTKNLANGDRLLTVLNRVNSTSSTTIATERIGLDPDNTYDAKDLWTGKTYTFSSSLSLTHVPGHGTSIFRISAHSSTHSSGLSVTPTGMIFNTYSLRCLTGASGGVVSFQECSGMDSQVWRINSYSMVSPLSAPQYCLEAASSGSAAVTLERCSQRTKAQKWTYTIDGNLISADGSTCLTESSVRGGGKATTAKCGFAVDSQVFGLPTGVNII